MESIGWLWGYRKARSGVDPNMVEAGELNLFIPLKTRKLLIPVLPYSRMVRKLDLNENTAHRRLFGMSFATLRVDFRGDVTLCYVTSGSATVSKKWSRNLH